MRDYLATAVLLAGMAVLPIGATAQEATDTDAATMPATQLSEADSKFVNDAAAAGNAEVELGQMAADNAESQEVKDFGQMMVDDHTRANEQLTTIAEQKEIEITDDMPPEAQQAQQQLEGLEGGEFDRAFMEQMITDHEKAISLFETQAQSGEDAELKQFAEQTLPVLQKHLEQAQQISTSITEMAGTTTEQPAEGSPEATAPAAGGVAVEEGEATTEEQAAGTDVTTEPPADTTPEDQAATTMDEPATTESQPGDTQEAAVPPSPFGSMMADDLIGKDVTNENGDGIGEIQDIVINQEDQAILAIISVGGFLGIGDKNVAVPFDELQQGQDENAVVLSGTTEEELKQMPAYDEGAGTYEDYPRDQPLSGGVQ